MKKLNKVLLVAATLAIVFPLFESCKKGPNDPGISLKSRDSRISAVWTLSGGSWQIDDIIQEVLNWTAGPDGDDCEDAVVTGLKEYTANISRTRTITFGAGAFSSSASNDRDDDNFTSWFPSEGLSWEINLSGQGIDDGSEWASGQTISRGLIIGNYELTIRKNGTFMVTFDYTLYEEDYPLPNLDDGGGTQEGKTFKGTYTGNGNWWWSNSAKNKSGITLEGLPVPMPTVTAVYVDDGSGNGIDEFDFNFVSSVDVMAVTTTFTIDRLANKDMTWMGVGDDMDVVTEITDEYEAEDQNNAGEWFDCIATTTTTTTTRWNVSLDFTSDGKNVKE